MAHQLPGSLRNTGCDRREQRLVQSPGDFNSQSSIGRDKTLSLHGLLELSRKACQDSHLRPACPEIRSLQKFTEWQRKARAERIPDGPHSALGSSQQQRAQHLRENMRMLVRIEV